MNRHSLLLAILCALPLSAAAQQAGEAASAYAPARYGRHSLTLQMGLLSRATVESSVTAGRTTSESRTNGFVGALTYAYRVTPDWAATLSVGLLDAGARSSAGVDVTTESSAVMNLLFGATYYPILSSGHPSLQPYLSGAVGPYLGFEDVTRVSASASNEVITETAMGFRATAGADWFVSPHFKIGVGAGYHFVTDFDEPIGMDKNYSGPEFSIGLGVLFGSGRIGL